MYFLPQASVLLYPASSEADITVLLHVIIWSSIGGLLLMVIFVVLLYFVSERICSKKIFPTMMKSNLLLRFILQARAWLDVCDKLGPGWICVTS